MNALRYILPIAIVLLAGLFFYSRSRQTPVTPPPTAATVASENRAEAKRILTNLSTVYEDAAKVLASVKDGPSAEAAVSQLEALGSQVEKALEVWGEVPDTFRTKFRPEAAIGYEKLKSLVDQTLALPGVSEKLKPTTDHLLAQLKTFA